MYHKHGVKPRDGMAASLTEGRAPFAASVASVFLVYVKEVTVTWVPFLGTADLASGKIQ